MYKWGSQLTWTDDIGSLRFQNGGDIVYSSRDEHGRILVIDDGDYRFLNFDSPFEQSCMSVRQPHRLVHPYTQLMVLVLSYIEPKHITLFGLGGGSLLRTLHHVLPSCVFSAVELRQKVVDIAKDFFFLPGGHRVKITVNDALKEIPKIESNTSDIIFSDMYDAYQINSAQTQKEFFLNCSRLLTSEGWLVINFYSRPKKRIEFFELLGKIFPTVIWSASEENSILLASNSKPEQLQKNTNRIEAIETVLNQGLSQLMPRLKPVNFQFP